MNEQANINFERVSAAIDYIKTHFKQQPSLADIAAHIHLSNFHFQRLFSEWAGTTPKKFLQYISLSHAKELLLQQDSLATVAYHTGFSGTGRLHDLFVRMEGMTPAEYKQGGKNLQINYSFDYTLFGKIIIASTSKGICFMAFVDDEATGLASLRSKFPQAQYHLQKDRLQEDALQIFQKDWSALPPIKLHLKGTDFQLKVWEALLKIPTAGLSTYGQIAERIHHPNASRAVGTAIGSNPIAFLIPCHRVIQATGIFGGYRWGPTRKTAIIGWESALQDEKKHETI